MPELPAWLFLSEDTMKIIKRNGEERDFDLARIVTAVTKASASVSPDHAISNSRIQELAEKAAQKCRSLGRAVHVEEIQDIVEECLMQAGFYQVARHYVTYRYQRTLARRGNTTDRQILSLIESCNELVRQENSNKNPTVVSVQRDYMAGEVSKDLTRRMFLPEDVVKAHDEGIIHFHDADYFAQHMHNCCLVNLEDMLQNGTVISGVMIEKPRSFLTACNIATQIIAQIASCQYGGQSISLAHLAPFVDVSRRRFLAEARSEAAEAGVELSCEQAAKIAERRVREEVRHGVQTLQYQVVTLMTTNGQAPFITVFMYLNEVPDGQLRDDLALIVEEVLKQRIEGVKNEKGVWITPAFPKLVYVLQDDNLHPGDRWFRLTELAAKCTAKRMVPDYISERMMLASKTDSNGDGHCYTCMGCRSFLTPYVGADGKPKYYGRFNQGVVTINLPDVALSADHEIEDFWGILNERLELCHRALQARHRRLEGTLSDAAPILWQHGALARLPRGERIDALLHGGYSTLSLGYAGLWECVYALTGRKLTEPEGEACGLEIMRALNECTAKWRKEENIDYSLYGTPIESTTYKFAQALQRRFGIVPGVSDRNYVTNSYHVHVTEPIDAFSKLELEAKFQLLSPGGAISYVEVPDMQGNIEAVLAVMRFIHNHIIYAELNTKSDCCQKCGWDGEIRIVEQDGKLVWQCPNCGNTDQGTMNVARRTCGYIGSQYWNQGRTQEIRERVLHL